MDFPGSNPYLVIFFSIEDEVVYINESARFNFYHYPNGSLVEVNNMFITRGRFNPMISKSFLLDI